MPISEVTFGPKTYLTLKKSIHTNQISDKQMYDDAGKKLGAYMSQNTLAPSGPWSVLYFTWDEANNKADIGISFPVMDLSEVTDPETKAAMDTLLGSYENLGKVHESLMQYSQEKSYSSQHMPVMAVEEYAVDPMQEQDPAKLVTNIYYLHN